MQSHDAKDYFSEYKVTLETNKWLQQCKVSGTATSHVKKQPHGGVDIQLETGKLVLEKGSSWSCPPFLGPLTIKAQSTSAKAQHFDATVSMDCPSLPGIPATIHTRVRFDVDNPVKPYVNHFFQIKSNKPQCLKNPNLLDAKVYIDHPLLPRLFNQSVKKVHLTANIQQNENTNAVFGLAVEGSGLVGTFQRLSPSLRTILSPNT